MQTRLTLGSLFDGSGGFPLAGVLSGIMPVWASEVEPYPIAVTRSRFPGMRTDSAEYKMWGNGIALPCAQYVLEGVAEEMRKPTETEAEGTLWEV